LRFCNRYHEVTYRHLSSSFCRFWHHYSTHTHKFTVVEAILFLNQPHAPWFCHASVLTSDQNTSQPAGPWKMLNIISECQKIFPRISLWLWGRFSVVLWRWKILTLLSSYTYLQQ
jgi:hypothetical protein